MKGHVGFNRPATKLQEELWESWHPITQNYLQRKKVRLPTGKSIPNGMVQLSKIHQELEDHQQHNNGCQTF
jgi:hypothetical protein